MKYLKAECDFKIVEELVHYLEQKGMFVEAKIITDSKEKMALQLRALLEENCNYFVLNLNSTTGDAYNFKKVAVKTN